MILPNQSKRHSSNMILVGENHGKSIQESHVKPREIKTSKVQNENSKVIEKVIEQHGIRIPYLPKTPSEETTTKADAQIEYKAGTKYQPASSTEYVNNEDDSKSVTSTMIYPSSSPREIGGYSY